MSCYWEILSLLNTGILIELSTVHHPVSCKKWMVARVLLSSSRDFIDKNWSRHFSKVVSALLVGRA